MRHITLHLSVADLSAVGLLRFICSASGKLNIKRRYVNCVGTLHSQSHEKRQHLNDQQNCQQSRNELEPQHLGDHHRLLC
ncbi:hypothetical protein BC829DRAFT_251211 [Chytridium lagenaria]|nr:hypothetical protein BC829DRAFT_251211 [Chytridium lagenaria]